MPGPAARGRVFANKDDVAVQAKADGERMYVVVDSGVFDITDFRHLHPGGEELFLAVKPGHDLTKMFIGAGARAGDPSSRSHKHSANARRMLETYRIGALPHGYRSTGGERSDDVPGVDDVQVDWSKGMVWQAGMMGDAYQPWINSTSVPFPVHYWDNHGFGAFCNKYSMCPCEFSTRRRARDYYSPAVPGQRWPAPPPAAPPAFGRSMHDLTLPAPSPPPFPRPPAPTQLRHNPLLRTQQQL